MNSESLSQTIIKTRDVKPNSVRAYIISLEKLHDAIKGTRTFTDLKFLTNVDAVKQALEDKALTTKRNYLTAIIVALKTDEKKYKKVLEKYSKYLDDLSKEYREFVVSQKKSEKQSKNWMTLGQVKQVRSELNKRINREGIRKMEEPNKKQLALLQRHLILSLYTYIPPIRNDYAGMRVVSKKQLERMPTEEREDNNWLILDKANMYFIFNDYKTRKTYGEKKIDIPKNLKRIIKKWLQFNKSGYLLIQQNGRPLGANGITRELNSIFKKYDKKIGSSMLRHIFLSSEFEPLMKKQKQLADAMMHSTNLQQEYVKE